MFQPTREAKIASAHHVKPGRRARRGLPLREIEVVSTVIIATLLCI